MTLDTKKAREICDAATAGPWTRVAYAESDQGIVMMLTGGKAGMDVKAIEKARELPVHDLAWARARMAKYWPAALDVIEAAEAAKVALEFCIGSAATASIYGDLTPALTRFANEVLKDE